MDNSAIQRYQKAKRALFDKAYSSLNNRQREAVFCVDGPLLVIAGAGSGKTTVLVRRIAQIIRYGNAYASDFCPGDLSERTVSALEAAAELPPDEIMPILDEFTQTPCPPWNVLAITFTNKAAGEIKARLSEMFDDPEVPKSIWAGTFHSICMRIIRKYHDRLGYNGNVTIYDTDDTKKLLQTVMKELNIDEKQFPIRSVAAEISKAKERLLSPEDYLAQAPNTYRERKTAQIYEAYQQRLSSSDALDFDDIIMQTVLLLRREDDVRQYYARKFRYVCVDEYQDTNPAQFALCSLFASEWNNIMVVGDDDQSIYRFRGATVENILNFDKTYPDATVIKLEQNYRSTKTILNAANAVIEKNSQRHKKELWTENDTGAGIVLEECPDQNEEARRITDIIMNKVAVKKYRYRDFAVLYRVNAQSNVIERTFAKSAVPYRIYGGVRFSDRKEIKDIVAYLQLINNHADRVRLKRIINEPRRKIGDATINAVEAIAEETGLSMFDVMKAAGSYTALSRSAQILTGFAEMIETLNKSLNDGCPLDAFVGQVLELTGYRKMLVAGGEAEKDRLDNIDEFVSGVMEYMKSNEEPTLTGFLEETALVADVDRYDETADAVVLMTVHSAKGLEFPVTFLPGMEEGIFPGTQSVYDPSELEEERRLAYVALTRAKNEVYVLHTSSRMLYGKTMRNPLSRFVGDIPDDLLVKVDNNIRRNNDNYADGYWQYGNTAGKKQIYYQQSGTEQRKAPKVIDELTVNKPIRAKATNTGVFVPGDRVSHPAFGQGEVISARKMGSDTLYEVIFESVGTKKLMASYARLSKV